MRRLALGLVVGRVTLGFAVWRVPFALLLAFTSAAAHADTWNDLWATREQQAQQLLESKKAAEAAPLFSDPRRRAYAELEAGQYAKAAEHLAPFKDADSQYNRGNALAHTGKLQDALAAYDAALAKSPDNRDAKRNRDLVAQALQQQSQQGQQQGGGNSQSGNQGKGQSQGGQGQQANRDQQGNPSQAANGGRPNKDGQSGSPSQPGKEGQQGDQGQHDNPSQAAKQAQSNRDGQSASQAQQGSQGQSAANQPQGANRAQQASPSGTPGTPPTNDLSDLTAKSQGAQPNDSGAPQAQPAPPQTAAQAQSQPAQAQASTQARAAAQPQTPAQARALADASQRGVSGADPISAQRALAGESASPEPPRSEQALALDQWLRGIPEDSGELLRRKFMIEHMMKQQGNEP